MSDASGGTHLLEWLQKHHPGLDQERIAAAVRFATEAHGSQRRKSGLPYTEHPFEVARILADNGLDTPSVIAGILHDVLEDTEVGVAEIEKAFGDDVAFLVEGVTKIGNLPSQSREQRQAETFRKMLVSMARDPRVIMIKFADRLHNLRTLRYMKPEKQKAIASETLEVYAPLAHRFGFGRIKWELEDLSFKYLYPEDYARLVRQIAERRSEREEYIRSVVAPLEERLRGSGMQQFEISGRPKHLYSIWRKLRERGQSDVDSIHDLNAVRVLTESVADCYAVLGWVHGLWAPIPGRFKDYIATPKSNMYQSLHTTIVGPQGRGVEVQIRTREMDLVANEGIAAHWAYKEGKGAKLSESAIANENKWLTQLMQWQKETADSGEFMEFLHGDLFHQEIFVYSPRGDLVQLPRGSTPIDFAFGIHTGLGLHVGGAKIDGKMVPISTQLQSGQTVEIIRSEAAHPVRDWLQIVRTAKAKSGIRKWLRQAEMESDRAIGREILTRELARRQMSPLTDEWEKNLLERFKCDGLDSLHERLGHGDITTATLVGFLPAPPQQRAKRKSLVDRVLRRTPKEPAAQTILVGGVEGIVYHRAGCCQPVPGEEIIGYITLGRGISLHRLDCMQGRKLIEKEGRMVEVDWHKDASALFWDVSLEVVARDRPNLLRDLTTAFSAAKVNILRASIATVGDSVRDRFRVQVHGLDELQNCLSHLRSVTGVRSAVRASRMA